MVQYLHPKLLYISLYSILGSAIPYLSLYYNSRLHLTSQQIGFILAIAPFIQSIACPFWTIQVDKRPEWHGRVMAISMIIGGASVISLMFIPLLFPNNENTATLLLTTILALIFAFFGQPNAVLVDSAVLKILGPYKIYYGDQRLWGSISNGICILLVGQLISYAGIEVSFYVFGGGVLLFIVIALKTHVTATEESEPLLITQSKMKRYNQNDTMNEDEFESHIHQYVPTDDINRRVSIASSHANTIMEGDPEHPALSLQYSITSMALRDVQDEANQLFSTMPSLGLALSHIPTVDTSLAGIADVVRETSTIQIMFSSLRIWTFLLMTLFFGISYSMVAQFLFLFLKNDLDLDSSSIGWTGPIGGVTEVSTFYISGKLINLYSVTTLVTVSHLVMILRNVAYEYLVPGHFTTTPIALVLQLTTGFSYAMIWSTCVSEVDNIFPPDQRSVAQGILASLFTGLGFGIGCILGGYFYDHYGSEMLFDVALGIGSLSLIIFFIGRLFSRD
ncbi:MFS general substrate transporter [Backusella circina FSU 941]|nr:MFS general substrate transporter [Backusella circina FSU 941]